MYLGCGPLPVTVANGGFFVYRDLHWNLLLLTGHNPGSDCYWKGATPKIYHHCSFKPMVII